MAKKVMKGMRYYSGKSVYEAALERIRFIFDEFPEVVVAISGGKDSTVCYHLALEVARERGRLPLKVMFIDQESEYPFTIDQIRKDMGNPEVEPIWLQVPFVLGNVSLENPWFNCWGEGEEWLRDKEPNSIHENTFGTDRFYKLFDNVFREMFRGQKVARIGGVRYT